MMKAYMETLLYINANDLTLSGESANFNVICPLDEIFKQHPDLNFLEGVNGHNALFLLKVYSCMQEGGNGIERTDETQTKVRVAVEGSKDLILKLLILSAIKY